jgi:hypothetical protein
MDKIKNDIINDDLPGNLIKKLSDYKNFNFNLGGLLESKSLVLNLVIFYIIYILTKDIIKGVISVVVYTGAIVFTAYYVNSYLKNKEENKSS